MDERKRWYGTLACVHRQAELCEAGLQETYSLFVVTEERVCNLLGFCTGIPFQVGWCKPVEISAEQTQQAYRTG